MGISCLCIHYVDVGILHLPELSDFPQTMILEQDLAMYLTTVNYTRVKLCWIELLQGGWLRYGVGASAASFWHPP